MQDRDAASVDVYMDSDWGGVSDIHGDDRLKSTSGGIVYVGGVPVKAWLRTQPTRAQSSAEAEAVAIEVGVSEGIGAQRLVEFLLQRPVDLR
eukprot:5722655-Alexandrium_andersonii.AAC.2